MDATARTNPPGNRQRRRLLSHDRNSWPDRRLLLHASALFIYTFWPENVFASQHQKTRLDYLLERKEQLYENLRDLNFEYKRGQVSRRRFQIQRALLENETAQLLAEIDHLQQA